jgi:3-oxoacyl-[acyl-carrier protein] reductase
MKLKGKIALITGAGSGIGRAIAHRFAEEGAKIVVNDLKIGAARRTLSEFKKGKGLAVAADVSDSAAVKRMFAKVKKELGRVDVLVNNAGIAVTDPSDYDRMNELTEARMEELLGGMGINTPWSITENLTDEAWHKMISVHLTGTFYCTREALRMMTASGRGGSIINMSSIAGLGGLENVPHYCAAKAGILGFTRAVARETGSQNIRVNAICPGFIETAMTSPIADVMKAAITAQTPLGRWGEPDDIAGAAAFLASDDASFCTGQWISPNGGIVMQ